MPATLPAQLRPPGEILHEVTVVSAPATQVLACCTNLYANPILELLVGDSFHPGGRAGSRALLSAAALPMGARLLDVGAGLGTSARLAAAEFGLRVDAVDVSDAIVERGRARGPDARVQWTVAALPRLPFPDHSFDAVLAECVLSMTERAAALAEVARVLRPGGLLLISDVETESLDFGSDLGPVVGAALCLGDAWMVGEMDRLLANLGFDQANRWDRSTDIIEMIDRAEARIGFVRVAAMGLGIDLADLLDAIGEPAWGADGKRLQTTVAGIRRAVAEGSLRYSALIGVAPLEAMP